MNAIAEANALAASIDAVLLPRLAAQADKLEAAIARLHA